MLPTKTRLPILLILTSTVLGCALMTSAMYYNASKPDISLKLSYPLYAVIVLILLLAFYYSSRCSKSVQAVCVESGSKRLSFASALLSAGLFYDFVHQCYNCYNYFENVGYIEYAYIVPIAISGVFALLSAAYFISFMLTVNKTGIDYRRFTFFHLMPILWSFFKVFILITDIFDVTRNVQDICNFILSVSVIVFFMTFAYASDGKERIAPKTYFAASLFSASMCFIVSVPHILMTLLRINNNVENGVYSAITYFVLGLFIVILFAENRKCEREKTS